MGELRNRQWLHYVRNHFDNRGISLDIKQKIVALDLGTLYAKLSASSSPTLLSRVCDVFRQPAPRSPFGVYLWGSVGSGKTLVLESFYRFLPYPEKKRFHFHHFMRMVHERLRDAEDRIDPLAAIAKDLRNHVIFLDEFLVNDIGDAMLIKGLLESLRARNVTLLMTSNTPPDALYEGGLQRDRFLPAIELISTHLEVMELNTAQDYRMRLLRSLGTYHTPCDIASDKAMREEMAALSNGVIYDDEEITVNDRPIRAIQVSSDAVWFSFESLCETARAASDYIHIASTYPAVLLSEVPKMDGRDDLARRFIHLIDVLYEHRVKLIVSAVAPASGLYASRQLQDEFQRAVSRLAEMNSDEYIQSTARRHNNSLK